MSFWHADATKAAFDIGEELLVVSDHQVVRVVTADQVLIETPAGERANAIVLDRTGELLSLALPDGRLVHLSMTDDQSLSPQVGRLPFSKQLWTIN